MARNRKPRKRYVPRPVSLAPVEDAIAFASILSRVQRQELSRPVARALGQLRSATGGWAAWCSMADAMNVAEQLALLGICNDRMPEVLAGQRALHAVHGRFTAGGSWTLRGEEIHALDEAVFIHDVQLQHCSQAELRDAIKATQRKVQQALKGNASPAALVCVGDLGHKAGTAQATSSTHQATT